MATHTTPMGGPSLRCVVAAAQQRNHSAMERTAGSVSQLPSARSPSKAKSMTPIVAEIIGWETLLVLALIALLFGGSRLPGLARSLGQAHKELQKALHDGAAEDDPPTPAA